MTQAQPRFTTFEEYLSYSDDLEGRFQLINGALIELPPESPENEFFALNLRDFLIQVVRRQLVRVHTCEVQVPVLQPKDAANRYPDLVVLRPEHLELMGRRLTITLDMSPPQLVVEVVSPGKTNRDRDYINKRSQYAAIGVSEYWLGDPSIFRGSDCLISLTSPDLALTVEQVFTG